MDENDVVLTVIRAAGDVACVVVMLEVLSKRDYGHHFFIQVLDIGSQASLVVRADDIPLLLHNSMEICHHYLDVERLRMALDSCHQK